MKIRLCLDNDLSAVYTIQLKCPQASQWRQEDYRDMAHDSRATILVAEIEGANLMKVAGFAVFHRVIDEAELRNLAIHPMYQRNGIARALLKEGIRTLQESGARRLFLEVRASNQPALDFYTSSGFQLLYKRHDYYKDPTEDAQVMACDISPEAVRTPR